MVAIGGLSLTTGALAADAILFNTEIDYLATVPMGVGERTGWWRRKGGVGGREEEEDGVVGLRDVPSSLFP